MIRKFLIILVPAYLIALILISLTPLTDPSEARYALIEKGMVTSGDWVTPRIYIDGILEPFLGKPPLVFWLGAISMRIFGVNEFAARLPSFIASMGLLAGIWFVLGRYAGKRAAAVGVLLTGCTPVFLLMAGAVLVDMVLAFFIVGALLCYYAFLKEPDRSLRKRWSLLVFLLLAGGWMVKGPIAILTFGMPVFVWTLWFGKWRGLRDHSWVAGIILFLALTVPWFWLCELKNPGFLDYFFIHENFLRFVTSDYGDKYGSGHVRARGTAVGMLLLASLPWVLCLVHWLSRQRRDAWRWMLRDEASMLFIAGVILNTLFWCAARQLLITYMLPMVCMLAIWAAIVTDRNRPRWTESTWFHTASVSFALVALASCGIVMGSSLSARDIMASVRSRMQGGDVSVVVVKKVPSSALFYGGDIVIPHADESAIDSFRRAAPDRKPCVYIVQKKYMKSLPSDVVDGLKLLQTAGSWNLYEKVVPASVPATER